MSSCLVRGKSAKVSVAKVQGSRGSCLGNPAGGFGLSWLKAVLGMKTMPPPNYFFFCPLCRGASERVAVHSTNKRKQKPELDSRGEDAMDVAQLEMSSSSVSAVSRPRKAIRSVYGEWSLLPR
ncbi:hypothetical protein GGI43DRAFT_289467 [Trichoderma evansii]